jgi:chitinase
VIGYWEGWATTRTTCAKRSLDGIPITAISHLNLAFAYITPGDYQIVAMPDGMSDQTFGEITNLKQRAPGLKIWISLGGWTFSDNGTSTQPVFGDIASTDAKRQKFVDNLYKFMKTWGFDGVDLDWEYPGAPDRGGHQQDGDNYVALLKQMRSTFDQRDPDFGISFTAPTSYWYLRWFPIDKMYQYANWINLMTYDL